MEEQVTLDLGNFIHTIRKRIKLILLITTLSTAVSVALSYYVIKPTYESKATIVIGKDDDNSNEKSKYEYNDIIMFQNLVKTYAEIAKSTTVAENASKDLKDVSVEDILKSITVTPKADTQLIEFKVENKNPKEACDMLEAVYNSFIKEGKRIYSGQNIQIMDEAKIPEKPAKPRKLLNITIAFFIGLMTSVGLTFLLEYMDNTLKTEEDINKYLDLPIIGVIPKDNEKY